MLIGSHMHSRNRKSNTNHNPKTLHCFLCHVAIQQYGDWLVHWPLMGGLPHPVQRGGA